MERDDADPNLIANVAEAVYTSFTMSFVAVPPPAPLCLIVTVGSAAGQSKGVAPSIWLPESKYF